MMGYKSIPFVPLFVAVHCAVLVTAGLVSCTQEASTKTFSIDGHQFIVPKEYLLPSQVAWFKTPKPSSNEFGFTNDPTLPLPEQFAVGVKSRRINCRPDLLTPGSMLASACSGDRQAQQFSDVSELRKELTYPGNDVFWTYAIEKPGSPRITIAYCHASVTPQVNDTCQVFGWYSNLVYSFSIEDRNIAQLDQRRAQINSLLAKWEQR